MTRVVLLVGACALAWPAVAGIQAKPDFSGQWTMGVEAPTAAASPAGAQAAGGARAGGRTGGRGARPGDMGSGWGPTFTMTQDARQLVVERIFFARGDMQPPLRFAYLLDGTEATNTVMMGHGAQTQVSKATWQGDTLVITTKHGFTDPETGKPMSSEVVQRLTLESATSLIVETTRAGVMGGPASTTRTVYRKGGAL